jgi:hypothetical protein
VSQCTAGYLASDPRGVTSVVGDHDVGNSQAVNAFSQRPSRLNPPIANPPVVLHNDFQIPGKCQVLQAIITNHDVDIGMHSEQLGCGSFTLVKNANRDLSQPSDQGGLVSKNV